MTQQQNKRVNWTREEMLRSTENGREDKMSSLIDTAMGWAILLGIAALLRWAFSTVVKKYGTNTSAASNNLRLPPDQKDRKNVAEQSPKNADAIIDEVLNVLKEADERLVGYGFAELGEQIRTLALKNRTELTTKMNNSADATPRSWVYGYSAESCHSLRRKPATLGAVAASWWPA